MNGNYECETAPENGKSYSENITTVLRCVNEEVKKSEKDKKRLLQLRVLLYILIDECKSNVTRIIRCDYQEDLVFCKENILLLNKSGWRVYSNNKQQYMIIAPGGSFIKSNDYMKWDEIKGD